MDKSLIQAYQQAHYVVRIERREKNICVGEPNPWLEALLHQNHQKTAAFITACNPKSELQSEEMNRANHHQLHMQIEQAKYPYFSGYSSDKLEVWPREESFLILGVSQRRAEQLARQFSQNAYLWATGGAVELRWLEY